MQAHPSFSMLHAGQGTRLQNLFISLIIPFPFLHKYTDPPEYNISQSFTINEGDTFNLSTLNLDANPIPGDGNYSWTFNGQPLMSGPGIELGVNSFLLSPVFRNQSGVYTITSFNRAGSGETSFALNVNCESF